MAIDNRTVAYGVFGGTVEHSLSPVMHNASFQALGFNCAYLGFAVTLEKLRDAVLGARALGFGGLSITIPLKTAIMELCDEIDPTAEMVGAVNTIKFFDDGRIAGYNTDGIGAIRALGECGVSVPGKSVLVLGAGGAARGIVFALAGQSAKKIVLLNRTVEKAERLAADLSENFDNIVIETAPLSAETARDNLGSCDLLINTTSIGMYPRTDQNPLDGVRLNPAVTVFDIVYNPMYTRLLEQARQADAQIVTGDLMLVYQAVEQVRIWLGIEPPAGVMIEALRNALTGPNGPKE